MNRFEQAKQSYQNIPLPEELGQQVEAGIQKGKRNRRRRQQSRLAAVTCMAVLVGALNLSPPIAAAAAEVPVVGGLFQILTIRSYDTEKDQAHYSVKVPALQADSDLTARVNAEIQNIVDRHIAEQQAYWEAYHEDFLATGGTEDQWAERDMQVKVDYRVMMQSDTTVSFVVDLSQCSVNASRTRYYYNLDLANGQTITLADVLGKDWVERCNASVQSHIAANTDADGFSLFFSPEMGGFISVDEHTDFYMREDGSAVVVFPEYSIAAGAAGIVEVPVK